MEIPSNCSIGMTWLDYCAIEVSAAIVEGSTDLNNCDPTWVAEVSFKYAQAMLAKKREVESFPTNSDEMTWLDRCAIKVMAGIIAGVTDLTDYEESWVANVAYNYAQAMIVKKRMIVKEREVEGSTPANQPEA